MAAKKLWASDDVAEWTTALNALESRMVSSGKKTKYGSLGPLHKKWSALGPNLSSSGGGSGGSGAAPFGKEELRTVMAYKLTRGKMRPLMRFVDRADDAAVRAASERALGTMDSNDCGPCFEAFGPISGVGVATASLIFAAADPSFVIMSDEAMEVTCGAPAHGKKYDLAGYRDLLRACTEKATVLGWAARDVEFAIFSASLGDEEPKKAVAKKRKRGK